MSATRSETNDDLLRRIKILSERLWEGHCTAPDVAEWLANFDGRHANDAETEKLHALHLLSSVSYFGLRELRVLLRALFRDHFRYRIVQSLRAGLGHTRDASTIGQLFGKELEATRFIGMGNPAESGTHLLYYFRQENHLPKNLFIHQHELLTTGASDPAADFASPELTRVVFIDDFCGSGQQSIEYSRTLLRDLKHVGQNRGRDLEFHYLVLFGTKAGLERAKRESGFDLVDAVAEVDDTYKTFGPESRVFRKPPDNIDKAISEAIARGYGKELWDQWPLGYRDGQLLLGFHHNVPDNSLPILWHDEGRRAWSPAFARHRKIY